tara:strand:- start:3492 stop:3743 length:252 start_codon:yes stop_codon:yes gene_type:complete
MSSILHSIGIKLKAALDAKLDKTGGTVTGSLNLSEPLGLSVKSQSDLPSAGVAGRLAYVQNLSCMAVDDGENWKKIELGQNLN